MGKNLNAAAAGGDAVITVAADNTPAAQKARADFVCSGANDDATIEALVAAGVTVKLMVGDYVFGASLDILVSNFRLEGSGPGTVISGTINVSYITIGDDSTTLENITICDLRIDGTLQTLRHGIFVDGSASNSMTKISILNCICENHTQDGISLEYGVNCHIIGNHTADCGNQGIDLILSTDSTIEDNTSLNDGNSGIQIMASEHCTISGNHINGSSVCINLAGDSNYNAVVGNTIRNADTEGITLYFANYNLVEGNTVEGAGNAGIEIDGGTGTSDHNIVQDNIIIASGQQTDNTFPGIRLRDAEHNLIQGNLCRQGALTNQPNYGIELTNEAIENTVRDNDLYDSGQTGPILDNGVDTKFNNITFQFIQGTTFISATGSAKGWEIDLAAEWAIALGQLPLELIQVVRIKIWAVGLVAPGAGNGMLIDVNMNAGQDDEAYTAEAIAIVAKVNTTDDFAIGDVIHWILTSVDDADIGDLVGGDSLEVQALFKAAVNGDIDTDAVFRTVEIEYVT